MKHLVQFSTGLSSAEVAWRLAAEHGPAAVVLMSADTLREDPDNWRFGAAVANRLGCEWVKLTDGRTPMEVGRDRSCVPSDRMPVCSQELKRELLRWYLDLAYDPAADCVYIGYDWSEPNRISRARKFWAPWTMVTLLADDPPKQPLGRLFRERGIEPPDLYKYNFPHANCGGACVRGGIDQWLKLLEVNRCRFLEWEADEEKTRALLGKDVSILKDRRHKTTRPLPLRVLREGREQTGELFSDGTDWGACGCDMDGPQKPQGIRKPPKVERWDGSGWVVISEVAA